jgi:hypothetical protein
MFPKYGGPSGRSRLTPPEAGRAQGRGANRLGGERFPRIELKALSSPARRSPRCVVGIPICIEVFRTLGANPVSMNWGEALTAFHQGTVDGHENPLALIIPYRLWEIQRHVILRHHAIDGLILAVSGTTWMSLSAEDRTIVRKAGEEIMVVQTKGSPGGTGSRHDTGHDPAALYGMEVIQLSPAEVQRFGRRPVRSTTSGLPRSG